MSSSSSSSRSSSPMPLFLRLRKADGERPTPYWEMDGQLRGECSTLNFGESPSVAVESTLSQILETTVPQKYYLSPRACSGILRRAVKRGKELPPILKTALEFQAGIRMQE